MRSTRAILVLLAALLATQAGRAGARGDSGRLLGEVLRHFRLMFVDQPNLDALLLGGLCGLQAQRPDLRVELTGAGHRFELTRAGQRLTIELEEVEDFGTLEQVLRRALRLAAGGRAPARKLVHGMVRGLVEHCGDRWTAFLEGGLYQRLLDDGSSRQGTVGIVPVRRGRRLLLLDVERQSRAWQLGLRPGQVLEAVAGRPAGQLGELEALAWLRGPLGKKVTVRVGGRDYQLEYQQEVRRNISVDPPAQGLARVHLHNFRAGTAERLRGVLAKLQGMGMQALLLDLRGNPGGLLTEGVEVARLFVPPGPLVAVVGRGRRRSEHYRAEVPGAYRNLPLVILIDERSASVAEMLAMVLRERRAVQLLGRPSLGKGVVQVLVELSDGSALKLSTARYATPAGRTLQGSVEPDIEVAAGASEQQWWEQARRVLQPGGK